MTCRVNIHLFRAGLLTAAVLLARIPPCQAQPAADVETILEQVETRGQSIDTLECRVEYTIEDRVTADLVQRSGTIRFKRNKPNPLFMISFDKTVQDGVVSRQGFWYLFDGRWFHEAQERSKSIIRRDIAPPGSEIDLFSIEKAPFPIPFGQKKAEVLKKFDVTLGPGDQSMPNADHLICIPKADSRMAQDHTRLEFFVDRTLQLPKRVVMLSKDRTKLTTADFPDLSTESINRNLPESKFQLPPETKGYAETVEQ